MSYLCKMKYHNISLETVRVNFSNCQPPCKFNEGVGGIALELPIRFQCDTKILTSIIRILLESKLHVQDIGPGSIVDSTHRRCMCFRPLNLDKHLIQRILNTSRVCYIEDKKSQLIFLVTASYKFVITFHVTITYPMVKGNYGVAVTLYVVLLVTTSLLII